MVYQIKARVINRIWYESGDSVPGHMTVHLCQTRKQK